MPPAGDRVVVAIGGNATHPENIRGTTEEQEQIAAAAARSLRPLVQAAPELVITHGNGPVVGKILLRQSYAREHIPPMRLDVCELSWERFAEGPVPEGAHAGGQYNNAELAHVCDRVVVL